MSVASYALATLDEIKAYFQFNSNATVAADDNLLEDLSNRVSIIFQTYCGRESFKASDYIEYVDGISNRYMFLKNYPINSITEVNEDSDWTWGSDTTVGSDEYRIIDSMYIVLKEAYWTQGDQNYKIQYNAGYETIPLDLKQICIEEVLRRFKHRKDFDVVAKSLENGSVTYTEKGLLTGTKQILDKYKINCVY